MPSRTKLLDDLDDLGVRAHVDAARRLVEDQEFRLRRQPARQNDLLLVAAGKLADRLARIRRDDPQRGDHLLRDFFLLLVRRAT